MSAARANKVVKGRVSPCLKGNRDGRIMPGSLGLLHLPVNKARCQYSLLKISLQTSAWLPVIIPCEGGLSQQGVVKERVFGTQLLLNYDADEALHQVYVKTFGEHVGFRIFMDSILLSLTRKVKHSKDLNSLSWWFQSYSISSRVHTLLQVRLPDVEFFVNLGDWPLEKRKPTDQIHPIFSWCGSNNTLDIVMPTYDLTESVLETMGRYKPRWNTLTRWTPAPLDSSIFDPQGQPGHDVGAGQYRPALAREKRHSLLEGPGQPSGTPGAGQALQGASRHGRRGLHQLLLL